MLVVEVVVNEYLSLYSLLDVLQTWAILPNVWCGGGNVGGGGGVVVVNVVVIVEVELVVV